MMKRRICVALSAMLLAGNVSVYAADLLLVKLLNLYLVKRKKDKIQMW